MAYGIRIPPYSCNIYNCPTYMGSKSATTLRIICNETLGEPVKGQVFRKRTDWEKFWKSRGVPSSWYITCVYTLYNKHSGSSVVPLASLSGTSSCSVGLLEVCCYWKIRWTTHWKDCIEHWINCLPFKFDYVGFSV